MTQQRHILMVADSSRESCSAKDMITYSLPMNGGSMHSGDPEIQLRYATLPRLLGRIAVHYWFVVRSSESDPWTRWEVWQTTNAGGHAIGHVHRDLLAHDAGVGGGPYRIARSWRGANAQRLATVLADAHGYAHAHRYRPWPGPNSNTFAAWVLETAKIPMLLDARAIGKDFHGWMSLRNLRHCWGWRADCVLGGISMGLRVGVELHVLGFTVGVSWAPLAFKTPLGDLYFAQFQRQKINSGSHADS